MNECENNKTSSQVFNASKMIFSENKKISPRQIRRALTLEIFGVSSLILPAHLASQSGIFGVPALAVGAAGAGVMAHLWDRLSGFRDPACGKAAEKTAAGDKEECRKAESKLSFIQKTVFVLAGCGLLDLAACVLYLLTDLLRDQLLDSRYEIAILLTLSIAGVFGLWKGLESRIRIYEVLFWILLIPLMIILVIACVSVRPVYWLHTSYSPAGFAGSCCESFLFFSLSALLLLFKPHCSDPERVGKSVRTSLLTVFLLDAAIYLILLGIFQSGLLSQLKYPVITLMAVVKLPGEFFERQDAFMVGIWFFCLFALFHSLLFYGKELLRHIPAEKAKITDRMYSRVYGPNRGGNAGGSEWGGASVTGSCICGAVVFLAALFFLRHTEMAGDWMKLSFCVVGPALLLLAVLYGINPGRKHLLLFLILPVLFLSGCGSSEPENLSFPLAMGIAARDDGAYQMYLAWPDLDDPDASENALSKDAYWDGDMDSLSEGIGQVSLSSSRNADMNHLKVLILERGMMDGGEHAEELIAFLCGNREISWNAYVFLTDGEINRLFSGEVQTGVCLGLYLENLLEGWSNIRSGTLVTVGDLISQYYNETETLLIPVVSISEGEPVVENVAVVDRLTDTGQRTLEEVFSSCDRMVIYQNE